MFATTQHSSNKNSDCNKNILSATTELTTTQWFQQQQHSEGLVTLTPVNPEILFETISAQPEWWCVYMTQSNVYSEID